jgi:hypothetical protein
MGLLKGKNGLNGKSENAANNAKSIYTGKRWFGWYPLQRTKAKSQALMAFFKKKLF